MSTSNFPVEDARGKRLRLRGFLKSEDVREGWGGLWMRLDGANGMLKLDNMNDRGATGTSDWALVDRRYRCTLKNCAQAPYHYELDTRIVECLEDLSETSVGHELPLAPWPLPTPHGANARVDSTKSSNV